MKVNNQFRFILGIMILTTSVLIYFHSIYWVLFLIFMGLNLIQFSFTNFCPLVNILEKINKK